MVKKSVFAICSVALLAVAFALPASAQDAQESHPIMVHGVRTTPIVPMPPTPFPTCTIFNNFGTPVNTNAWEVVTGYYVTGPTSPSLGFSQATAVPFKGKAGCTHVNKFQAPIQDYATLLGDAGTNGFEGAIYSDNLGLPNVAIATSTHKLATQTAFTCCVAQAVGVPSTLLTTGTQYWAEADANLAQDTATEDLWLIEGSPNAAFNQNSTGWNPTPGNYFPAVKVTGTP
jgi:hypothetical protein